MAISNLYDSMFNDTFGNAFGSQSRSRFALGSNGAGNFSKNNYGYGAEGFNSLSADPNQENGNAEQAPGQAPGQTFAQQQLGTDNTTLFGRNLIHNPANDIAAGNTPQSQEIYQQRINPQPTSMGANPVNPAATNPVNPATTQSKDVVREGNNYSDGRVQEI